MLTKDQAIKLHKNPIVIKVAVAASLDGWGLGIIQVILGTTGTEHCMLKFFQGQADLYRILAKKTRRRLPKGFSFSLLSIGSPRDPGQYRPFPPLAAFGRLLRVKCTSIIRYSKKSKGADHRVCRCNAASVPQHCT